MAFGADCCSVLDIIFHGSALGLFAQIKQTIIGCSEGQLSVCHQDMFQPGGLPSSLLVNYWFVEGASDWFSFSQKQTHLIFDPSLELEQVCFRHLNTFPGYLILSCLHLRIILYINYNSRLGR